MDPIITHNLPPRKRVLDYAKRDMHQRTSRSPGQPADDTAPANIEQVKLQMQRLAWLMDESIPIPFMGVSFGMDGLLGLIPGVGDLISAGISSFIIRQAHVLGVPKVILLRMSFNTAIDLVIGSIPLLGDIFDFGWKANKRNVKLVLEHLEHPKQARRANWFAVAGMIASIALIALASIYAVASLIAWLVK